MCNTVLVYMIDYESIIYDIMLYKTYINTGIFPDILTTSKVIGIYIRNIIYVIIQNIDRFLLHQNYLKLLIN